jgi:hypothetical protein
VQSLNGADSNENKTSLDYAPGAELSAEADGGMPERC